jgi:methylenetetrahydrofolate reductase (NADPH)
MGADLIITQLFYDVDEYLDYVDNCRKIGITCPILPGLLPIQNYNSFKKITALCSLKVSDALERKLEEKKNNDDEIKQLGIDVVVDICQKLMDKGVPYFHFYTLNLEKSVMEVLNTLHFKMSSEKEFPWKKVNYN